MKRIKQTNSDMLQHFFDKVVDAPASMHRHISTGCVCAAKTVEFHRFNSSIEWWPFTFSFQGCIPDYRLLRPIGYFRFEMCGFEGHFWAA